MGTVVKESIIKVFSDIVFKLLGVSLVVNMLLIYYFIFLQTTTVEVFFASNNSFYNWISIFLTIVISVLFSIAVSMTVYSYKQKSLSGSAGSSGFFGAVFGAISTGCPVCGAYLLPVLGIAGSLTAFPFQGLEIKVFSIILLIFAIWESSKIVAGICSPTKEKLLSWTKKDFVISINRVTLSQTKPFMILGIFILVLYLLPLLPAGYKFSFAAQSSLASNATDQTQSSTLSIDASSLFVQVNPLQGYTVNATYGDVGPKLLAAGAIDLEKFKAVYERSGVSLTDEQLKILTEGSNQKVTVNKDNAYFLINFLWALGLANKNEILDEGDMTKYGKGKIGTFASTGGWTIGKTSAENIYSKTTLFTLTSAQQAILDEAANGTYRPCCGNSTAFPDCNHGMAMLGLYELMASQGATADELFEAGKYFNAFWFPQQTLDIATYFKAKEGKDFSDVDPRVVVSKDYSSGGGWSKTKRWLANNNLVEKAPSGGGGCGV